MHTTAVNAGPCSPFPAWTSSGTSTISPRKSRRWAGGSTAQSRHRERRRESWYDRAFGVFGPFISSIIGLTTHPARHPGAHHGERPGRMAHAGRELPQRLHRSPVRTHAARGYVSYFSRKYHPFRWAAPLIGGIIFYIMLWLASIILSALSVDLSTPTLQAIASQFTILVLPLTLLIIGVGYIGLFFSLSRHDEHPLPPTPPSPTTTLPTTPVQPPMPAPAAPPARLYRSGRERILGGVCGGIAEYPQHRPGHHPRGVRHRHGPLLRRPRPRVLPAVDPRAAQPQSALVTSKKKATLKRHPPLLFRSV